MKTAFRDSRRRGVFLGLAAAALIATVSSGASANGRYPQSSQVVFAPSDPNLMLVRVTFGLLVSHDKGTTWDWVCEKAIGFGGIEDPMYAVTTSGTYLATTFQGLSISHDQACGWSFAGGPLEKLVFIDLAQRPNDRRAVVTFASSYDYADAATPFFDSRLFETKDDGQTFAPLGAALDPSLLGETVDVAESDPQRLYISALREPGTTPKGFILTSQNAAQTWTETLVPLIDTERALFIAAVDPKNADRLYVRTSNAPDKPTRLLVSEDGAKTFKLIFTAAASLTGFALSADGSKIYIGSPADGLQVASTTDYVFTKRADTEIGCLALSPEGLWACSSERSGFVLGLSTDDGATFTDKLHLCEPKGIRGPLSCAAGTPTDTACVPLWPAQRAFIGCGGGALDAGADASTADAGPTPIYDLGGGCACTTAPKASWPLAALGAFGAIAGGFVSILRRARRKK